MSICFFTPRFYPAIGGVETYLKDIIEYCSSFFKISVITSNLRYIPTNPFEKPQFLKKNYDLLNNNVEIYRGNISENVILRAQFYLNQYLNKKIEIYYEKVLTNKNRYRNTYIGKSFLDLINKSLIFQRFFFSPNFLQLYFILKKINIQQKIDLIHSSPLYFNANIYAFKFSKKKKIPFVCTPLYHINPYSDYIFYPSFQYVLKNSDAIIACTNLEKKFYQKYGINQNKIHIIPPGIDPNVYKKKELKNFRQEYNIPLDSPLLLFMGRKDFRKGIVHTIYALKYLKDKYKNIKLIIAGPSTREYEKFFKNISIELKKHIIDLGIVDNPTKSAILECCDILILPSLDDAFGIVYLEAWLFKKPVIGVLGGNVEGLIENNIDGFLVPFNDIKSLAIKIGNLVDNEYLKNELGQNGYNKLINNYLLEITNKKMLNLYKKLINRSDS